MEMLLGITAFWLVILLIAQKVDLGKNFSIAPLIIMFKTERLNAMYTNLGSNHKSLIKFIGNFSYKSSLVVFFGAPIILLANALFIHAPLLTSDPIAELSVEGLILAVIPLLFALAVHEIMHAVVAISENVPVDSSGFMFFGIFFGVFVQFNKQIKKVSVRSQLKVASAGITANFLLALLLIPLIASTSLLVFPLYERADGAVVVAVEKNSPADLAGIIRGDIITKITLLDQYMVPQEVIFVHSAEDAMHTFQRITAGSPFSIQTHRTQTLLTGESTAINGPSLSVAVGADIGINVFQYYQPRIAGLSVFFPYWLHTEIVWLINFSLMLGFFNILPLPFTDGSKILDGITKQIKRHRLVISSTQLIVGLLLVANIYPQFFS